MKNNIYKKRKILIDLGEKIMQKENIYKLLYTISILLIIAFVIILGADYFKYDNLNNSAPFYTFIIARIIEFIIPSIIVLIIGKVMKKKYSK